MPKKETYARLPYSLYASEAWQKYPYDPVKAYIDLCFRVPQRKKVYNCKYGTFNLSRGEMVVSEHDLEKFWHTTRGMVRSFIRALEGLNLIQTKAQTNGFNRYTILTVNALHLSSNDSQNQGAEQHNNIIIPNGNNSESDVRASGFVIPALQEIQQYLDEKGEHRFTAEEFYDYYDTRGWFLARGVKMKSWKGAVRTWIGKRNNGEFIKVNRYDYISRSAIKAQEKARRQEEFRQHIIAKLTRPAEPPEELPFQ